MSLFPLSAEFCKADGKGRSVPRAAPGGVITWSEYLSPASLSPEAHHRRMVQPVTKPHIERLDAYFPERGMSSEGTKNDAHGSDARWYPASDGASGF